MPNKPIMLPPRTPADKERVLEVLVTTTTSITLMGGAFPLSS